jgi:hypothetical protein
VVTKHFLDKNTNMVVKHSLDKNTNMVVRSYVGPAFMYDGHVYLSVYLDNHGGSGACHTEG